jgi:hypothetical protein
MAVNLSPVGGVAGQFFDNNGDPLVGGKLFTFAAGTTTPQVTYTSATGVTPNSNPIILNGGGRVPSEIWLTDGLQYKFVLYSSTDQLIGSWDNIVGINSNFVNFTSQQEIQTATANQTVFTLTTMQYQPGTNSLSVFVDGVNQYGPGAQFAYVETNGTTVTFANGLHVGALVKFTTSSLNSSAAGDASQVSFTGFKGQTGTVSDLAGNDGSDWIGYEPAGSGAVAMSVQDKLRETVSVKDFGAVGDGVADDTAAIQNAINAAVGKVLLGVNGETYKIFDMLEFPSDGNIDINFNGATLLDNVQGTWPARGNAPRALFFINETENISITNFNYDCANTRYTDPLNATEILAVGITAAGASAFIDSNNPQTRNIEISNVYAENCPINCIFVSVLGNALNLKFENFNIIGDCNIGINFEYGLRPDPDYSLLNPNWANIEPYYGLHPYNAIVNGFNGYNNTTCVGFLRVASTYNVQFNNCYGYNVDAFIYTYFGDRGIFRILQNVEFNNCSAFCSETNTSYDQPAVTVIATAVDPATGSPLPAFTKYDYKITFNNCEFQTNKAAWGVRFVGMQGACVLNSCVFRDCLVGLRTGQSSPSVTYTSENVLALNDCIFIDNDQDVFLSAIRGVTFTNCKFKDQTGVATPIVESGNEARYCRFTNCYFTGLKADRPYIELNGPFNQFYGCRFESPGTQPNVVLTNVAYGSANFTDGTLFTTGFSPNSMPSDRLLFSLSALGAGTNTFWTVGAGSPEGVVTANVASMYTRTDGGAGTTLYVKETGTGNTGWVAK